MFSEGCTEAETETIESITLGAFFSNLEKFKLSESNQETTKYLTWISSHPDSKDRAEYIIEYSKGKEKNYKQILTNETWNKLKAVFMDQKTNLLPAACK